MFSISIIFFVCCTHFFWAQNVQPNNINEKIIKNRELFKSEPQKAFKEIDILLDEAIKQKDAVAELKILSTRYEYDYLLEIDFEQMISSANILKDRAIAHKNQLYEAKSHKYLAQTYSFNELYDKALDELKLGLQVTNKVDPETSQIIMERANIHTAFANIYNLKGEFFNGIESLLKSGKEHDKLKDPELKRGTKFMDYANLGGAYLRVNIDSAKYYANASIKLSTPEETNHNLIFINYLVIGNVHLEKKEYDQALKYYKKAENIKENKHFLNIKELYTRFISVYDALGDSELKNNYEVKLKDLSLTVAQTQNKTLRKIILDDRKQVQDPNPQKKIWLWIGMGIIVVLGIVIIFKFKTKEKNQTNLTPEDFNKLIKLLKENNQTFLLAFENQFPNFIQNLEKKGAELSTSEIELLAMIKVGLSNKEIAQYKFIQHKTVQNKRHIIRKKLNLSSDTDLNKWIEDL